MKVIFTLFKEMYEEALFNKTIDSQKNRSNKYNHPSEITGCARQFWYKINDYEKSDVPSLAMMSIWEQGHALHESLGFLTGLIPDIQDYTLEQAVGDKEYNSGGHSDLVIKTNDKWYVVDFKTAGTTKFKEVKKKGLPVEYLWQVNFYIYLLKKKHPRKYKSLDSAYVLFINKSPIPSEIFEAQGKPNLTINNSPLYEIKVEYDEDLVETEILPQLEYLQDVRGMDEPPEREISDTCKFCDFRTLCLGDE